MNLVHDKNGTVFDVGIADELVSVVEYFHQLKDVGCEIDTSLFPSLIQSYGTIRAAEIMAGGDLSAAPKQSCGKWKPNRVSILR